MKINSDTVVIITGASRGIGKATALAFAQKRARIVLASRDMAQLQNTRENVTKLGSEALLLACDVSIEKECHDLIDNVIGHWGHVDVLINNAGFGHYSSIENLSTDSLDRIFRTNLFGALWCTQAVLPSMKRQHRGHIVNVSTIISHRSLPFMTAYCMTKFAMNALDEGLRLEVRPFGIGVSLICPGLTKTDFQMNAGRVSLAPALRSHGGMAPEKVARSIVRSVEHNRRRVALTVSGKILLALQKLSPSLVDEILHVYFSWKTSKLANTM